jgi:hypothetical protein
VSERNEIDLAKIAHIDARIAELHGEISELMMQRAHVGQGLSKANVNMRTGRKVHRAHEPKLDPVVPGIQPALDSANRVRTARRRTGT